MIKITGGWAQIYEGRKWHFFGENGRSLCGKWSILPFKLEELNQNGGESEQDCLMCRRVLYARRNRK